MRIKVFLLQFLLVFCVALVVNVLVTLFWNYFIKDAGAIINWETSFSMAITFAILIPVVRGGKK